MCVCVWGGGGGGHEIFLFLKGGTHIVVTFVRRGGEFSESQQNSRSPLEEKLILS